MPETQERSPERQRAAILVHGTRFFGLKPSWTEPGSTLRTRLEERFGDSLHLSTIPWSGRNTHGARSGAAAKLNARLDENAREFPEAEQVVICHSHGGNAALYALRDSPHASKVKVVTLATPFLVARKRDFGPKGLYYFTSGGLLVAWLAVWLLERTTWHESLRSFWQEVSNFGVIMLVVAALGAVGWFWYRHAGRLLDDMKLASLRPEQLLIVRAPGDEASGALSLFQFIVQLCTRVFSLLTGLHRRTSLWIRSMSWWRALAIVIVGFVCSFGSFIGSAFVTHPVLKIPAIVLAVLAGVIVVMVFPRLIGLGDWNSSLVAFLAGAVLWPIILLLSLLLLPFGWRIALANVLLDVTVEATPLGHHETHLCPSPTIEESGAVATPLAHSAIYENPRVLDLICRFVQGAS